ncbi:MAG: glucose-6-phosphate isomerase [Chloroflexi bacterium]|jgi:glucose-6-phosphate isomerase|nr:glucose-6-phosphate isomerase [Chloroflexota bacterium]
MNLMQPFSTYLDLESGVITPVDHVIRRHLSDMCHMYADESAAQRILETEGDRLIYEVYPVDLPEEEGQVLHSTTVLHPGRVGSEYHMTKGHFHVKRDRAEIYVGLAGEGCLLMQTGDGRVSSVKMARGIIAYVPPYWAHRTVNTGDVPFAFLAAWPGDSGHDYGTIETRGFAKILVERGGVPVFVDNPKYRIEDRERA